MMWNEQHELNEIDFTGLETRACICFVFVARYLRYLR